MRKALFLCLMLFVAVPAAFGRQRAFGYCSQGGVTLTVSGLTISQSVQGTFPACTVTVYFAGTTNLAQIFSDNLGTVKANPFTADSTTGFFFFYADNGRYDVRFSGGGIPTPFTIGDVLLNDIVTLTNDTSFGTAQNFLVKLSSAGAAIKAAVTDIGGVVGICASNCGITGAANIVAIGPIGCVFDGATTASDYVQISSSVAGNCHDVGSTYPTNNQVLGRVLSTNASAGTYTMDFFSPETRAGGGGGASALSALTVAVGPNTLSNGNNPQVWNWAQTSINQAGISFGESSASTSGSLGNQYTVKISTLSGSTAVPLNIFNTLTGTQTLPALHITPTWNTTGIVDAALLINVTNTASGAGSLLADFQVGSVSQWNVDKLGNEFAKAIKDSSLTNGNCMQAGSGGLLTTVTGPCVLPSLPQTWTAIQTYNQSFNGADMINGARFSDSSPSGNFLRLRNAALNVDLYKVDVQGNITAANLTGTGVTVTGSVTAGAMGTTAPNTWSTLQTFAVGLQSNQLATFLQSANGVDTINAVRFTDTSPTGNFLRFRNAALNADLYKVDVLGNVTANSYVTNGSGAALMGLTYNGTSCPTSNASEALFCANPTGIGTLGENAGTNFPILGGNTIANEGITGTTLYTVAKATGAPATAKIYATTDTVPPLGIVVGGAGTTGSALIRKYGQLSCVFDGGTTADDIVVPSTTVAGNCHDSGATTDPGTGWIYGTVLSTNAAGGTYAMDFFPRRASIGSPATTCTFTSGGGTSPSCAVTTGSNSSAGTIILTSGSGSPAANGTFTLTFAVNFGSNPPSCVWMLSDAGAGQWNARATVIDKTPAIGSDVVNWDNNVTNLSTSTAYQATYSCGAH